MVDLSLLLFGVIRLDQVSLVIIELLQTRLETVFPCNRFRFVLAFDRLMHRPIDVI